MNNSQDITDARLYNHRLLGKKFSKPEQVVEHLGAVQSQDYAAAKWALGMRCAGITEADVEKAYNDGAILRTHIMRPTWHFVTPENLRWMQALTSSRVLVGNSSMLRKLELDDKILERCHEIITQRLLGKNYATREELALALEEQGIAARGQRLAYIVMQAELSAFICSGPRRGKQFTYALVSERVVVQKVLDREEALAKLALTYFSSHGPAQIKDFSWWSGLTIKDSQLAVELNKTHLESMVVNDKTYWFKPATLPIRSNEPHAFLLSIYDEYTIAYRDRTDMSEQRDIERLIKMGNALTAVVVLEGKVVGTWKRSLSKSTVSVKASLFRPVDKKELAALKLNAEQYGIFLGLEAELVV